MSTLDKDWKPSYEAVHTWIAMDKNGLLALMMNNYWGNIPQALLSIENISTHMDEVNDYLFDGIEKNTSSSNQFSLDLQSFCQYKRFPNADSVINELKGFTESDEYPMLTHKGFFLFEAVEGTHTGTNLDFGQSNTSSCGDYYRLLIPSVFQSVEDLPNHLRKSIAVSETLDFTQDRFMQKDTINELFSKAYETNLSAEFDSRISDIISKMM